MSGPGHAIVSGGSSGIGLAVAGRLAEQGWNLSLIARDPAKLEAARKQLAGRTAETGQAVHIYSADLAEATAAGAAAAQAIAALGPPALLVTSAGITRPGNFEDLPIEIFHRLMAVNYFGTLYLIKAVLPAMREARRGHLVMVSSGAGLIGIHGYCAYAPTKFALRGLAESLRGELAPEGIQVSIVYPPDTDTPQLAAEAALKPPQTKRITASARVLSAETVAEAVMRGIRRRRFAITPGLEMSLLSPLHSLIAPLLRRRFDALARRARAG